jgi:hypothetical protein
MEFAQFEFKSFLLVELSQSLRKQTAFGNPKRKRGNTTKFLAYASGYPNEPTAHA